MKLRPTIFLSGVSSEFGSFRDAVEVEVQKKGCFAENQSSFGVDYRTVEEMLRRKLHDADAVIHIVGFRFGAEPEDRPPDKPRRSYTQMEYDIARELEKPIYVFLSSNAAVRDTPTSDEQPEDSEATALQLAHRQTIKSTNNLRYTFKDKNELRHLAAEIDVVAKADFRVDISRIDKYAPAELIGREEELALLDDAWLKVRRAESRRPHILTFVALGGEGKTSLIAKWAAEMAYQHWPGCDSAFAWSFYSQGTREEHAASSDLFLKEAISFFGSEADKEFAASAAGAYEKGQRLARIVGQRRALLILDGLEPLQYAPTSPTRGELKDAGILALLKSLAAHSDGLCIVTTRYSLSNLKAFWQTTAPEAVLNRLSKAAGAHLLKTLGVKGLSKEFETLIEDVKGHALTLNLLGTYLKDAHGGDIRRRDLIKLEEADAEEQGGHAFRVMEAYERAFDSQGEKGKRALVILRLLGLFDRPVSADCLNAFLKEPAIDGLTEPLGGLSEAQRNLALTRLAHAKLLTVNYDASGTLVSIDAHPLLREYFGRHLRMQHSEAWRKAHLRMYEYLSLTTPDEPEPTLEDLQPLYQAVGHGCQAGLYQDACREVYLSRIVRKDNFYSTKKLGAYASDLGAAAWFFETLWTRVSPRLSELAQAWILSVTGANLRALGRLGEAADLWRAAATADVTAERWAAAAVDCQNVSELELTLGELDKSLESAELSAKFASGKHETFLWSAGVSKADVLCQAGRPTEAKYLFNEIERMMATKQPELPLLYSVPGFLYCDLLLSVIERTAWGWALNVGNLPADLKVLDDVSRRATQSLTLVTQQKWLLDIALDRLTLSRVTLYEAVLSQTNSLLQIEKPNLIHTLDSAVKGLSSASRQDYLPRAILTRAWSRFLMGLRTGPESAQEDLDEAWEIAERGPMRLFMADIHLYRARLFFREAEYPWESPQKDLEEAERLINECGYHRRDEELADAKRVILGQSV